MSEPHFEMLWDCTQCGARGLLAKTHRHCPNCGAVQNPDHRHFPEPGQEVVVRNHRFAGRDWRCAYCETPNAAASAFCGNCGAPKDGTKEVALIQDTVAAVKPPPETPPAPSGARSAKGFPWLHVAMVLVVAALVGWLYLLLSKHQETVQLVDKAWTREVSVEHFTAVRASDWCDSLPAGAYAISSQREQRSTRQVEDGQTCHTVRADMGDGTFTQRQECSPRYRSEPVYDNRCNYRINRWQTLRTDTLKGGATLAPAWPTPVLANPLVGGNGITLGAQRLGSRSESYTVQLQSLKGQIWTCPVDASLWTALAQGQSLSIKVRGTGGAVCDSVGRAAQP